MKWADNGGGDFEQPPIGTHVARCIHVIDIGTQRGEYQGKATSRRQCIIGWELPTELQSEGDFAGQPFRVSRFYTASLGKKASLRADLQNWRGRDFTEEELSGFDSKAIVGKPCMLSLILSDKGKAKVSGIMAMPKGMEMPMQVLPSIYFSLDQFDPQVYEGLSDGIKKMIVTSPEYIAVTKPRTGSMPQASDEVDDIPF